MSCKHVRQLIPLSLLLLAAASFGNRTLAQDRSTFHSDVDDLLTIETVTVLPFTDNLQGIYVRPLEANFISAVEQMHRWNYVPANNTGEVLSPQQLEDSVDKSKQIGTGLGVDAFFAGRVTKGPNGVTIHLSLILSKDGKLLSQAILKDYKQFDLKDLKEQLDRMLTEVSSRLPYAGRVLSREGQRVTVNLGTRDGLEVGQVLSIIQLLQVQRHPKFNFLIRTDKEIFGKIKILKVDQTLSFGMVVTEKEKGAIQKNAKVGSIDFVTYSNPDSLSQTPGAEEALLQREDGNIAFGKGAKAWVPSAAPTFGQLGGRIGLGRLTQNAELNTGGGLSVTDNLSPSVALEGEIWITPEWTFSARLRQGIVQVDNPRSGSEPTKLNQSMSSYEAAVGYMFRFGPHVWSPNISPFLGYFTYKMYSDTASPEVFNTMDYSGFKFGLRGTTPLGEGLDYGAGGEFSMAWKPGLHESPVGSGGSSNNVVQFSIFGYQKMGERLKAQVQIDFDMYSSTFGGGGSRTDPASSTSIRSTTLSGGMYYLF